MFSNSVLLTGCVKSEIYDLQEQNDYRHSLIINLSTWSGSGNSPCGQERIDSVKIKPSLPVRERPLFSPLDHFYLSPSIPIRLRQLSRRLAWVRLKTIFHQEIVSQLRNCRLWIWIWQIHKKFLIRKHQSIRILDFRIWICLSWSSTAYTTSSKLAETSCRTKKLKHYCYLRHYVNAEEWEHFLLLKTFNLFAACWSPWTSPSHMEEGWGSRNSSWRFLVNSGLRARGAGRESQALIKERDLVLSSKLKRH